jgi:hypothetical protein
VESRNLAFIALTLAPIRVEAAITNPDRMALIAAAECEPLPEELRCRK